MVKNNKQINKINFFNIKEVFKLLLELKFIHFFIVSGTGLILNLSLVVIFTEFVFGREKYFYAYLIGLFLNLFYNFFLHSKITFKTKDKFKKRFIFFITYNLLISILQAILVKKITKYFGIDYYLIIIILIIGIFFIFNFIISKKIIFKKLKM